MAEVKGIKESLEFLAGVKDLVIDAKKILADGKVSLADLPVAMDLLNQLADLNAALKGVDAIPAEVKDLSADEANQLVAKILEIVAAVKAA